MWAACSVRGRLGRVIGLIPDVICVCRSYGVRDMAVHQTSVILKSTITCPACGHRKTETMPTVACQWFYDCRHCGAVLKPRPGDCCVYCAYATVPWPRASASSWWSGKTDCRSSSCRMQGRTISSVDGPSGSTIGRLERTTAGAMSRPFSRARSRHRCCSCARTGSAFRLRVASVASAPRSQPLSSALLQSPAIW